MNFKCFINTLKDTIKNLDLKVKKIMSNGLYFSLLVAIIGTLFLLYYIFFNSPNLIYYIGLKVVWLGICFGVYFFSCAVAIDKIKKDLT